VSPWQCCSVFSPGRLHTWSFVPPARRPHLDDGGGFAASSARRSAGRRLDVPTFYLCIHPDGRGSAEWPIHVRCGTGVGEGPPPRDKSVPTHAKVDGTTHTGYEIVDGDHATMRLTSVTSTTAHGVITASTDRATLPDGPTTFRVVTKYDVSYVTPHTFPTGPSPFRGSAFCGPRAHRMFDGRSSMQIPKSVNGGVEPRGIGRFPSRTVAGWIPAPAGSSCGAVTAHARTCPSG
jgi:hypothetical protein